MPDTDGSNHDRDAIRFLQNINTAVHAAFPDVQTFAEESTAWDGVTRPVGPRRPRASATSGTSAGCTTRSSYLRRDPSTGSTTTTS